MEQQGIFFFYYLYCVFFYDECVTLGLKLTESIFGTLIQQEEHSSWGLGLATPLGWRCHQHLSWKDQSFSEPASRLETLSGPRGTTLALSGTPSGGEKLLVTETFQF